MTFHSVLQYQIEGTAAYQTANLAKLLSPLGTSEYTISNTKVFVKQIRKVPLGCKMVSFDVTSFFTNKTIEIILERVYERRK